MKKTEKVENLLRFILTPGIGSVTMARLLRHFGNSDAILGATEAQLLQVPEMRPAQIKATLQARKIDPRQELEAAQKAEVNLLTYDDDDYPPALLNIADPPFLLYVKGKLLLSDQQSLAIVGTRNPSRYGCEQSERFAAGLARVGYTVISGLARGIDTCAHRGALAVGGRTIAFVGCGFKHTYPPENRDLLAEIAQHGAAISEFPLDVLPTAQNFPRRNRLIAGLSLGVLVIEAPERSGSLITARQANEMGREVFAIPGRIDHEQCSGCHSLIRDGAVLVRRLDDILEELPLFTGVITTQKETRNNEDENDKGDNNADENNNDEISNVADEEITVKKPRKKSTRKASATKIADESPMTANTAEQKILSLLKQNAQLHIDEIANALNINTATLLAQLLMLELRGAITQLPGKFFAKK